MERTLGLLKTRYFSPCTEPVRELNLVERVRRNKIEIHGLPMADLQSQTGAANKIKGRNPFRFRKLFKQTSLFERQYPGLHFHVQERVANSCVFWDPDVFPS